MTTLVCPLCQAVFNFGIEEYCPHDGERLLLAAQADSHQVQADTSTSALSPSMEAILSETAVPGLARGSAPTPPLPENFAEQRHETPSAAEEPTPAPSVLDRVKEMVSRFGIRPVADPQRGEGSTPAGPAQKNAQAQAPSSASAAIPQATMNSDDNLLPDQIRDEGWVVAGPLMTDSVADIDIWPVERAGVRARFARYRNPPLTSRATFEALRTAQSQALPALLAFGTANLRGHAHANFDLCAFPEHAQMQLLNEWMASAPPSEAKATALMPALIGLLDTLDASGFAPISLHPAQLLRHSGNGRIVLNHVAALTKVGPPEYSPALERSPFISRLFTAPEVWEQLVIHQTKAGVYSVGQILATALWGQPVDIAALRAGQVPLRSICDHRLARVLQGCLWIHNAAGRWDREQLSQSMHADVGNMPTVEDWGRLGPGAMASAFSLAGRSFWRVEDCVEAAVAPAIWTQTTSRIHALLDWIEGSIWASIVPPLRESFRHGQSADWVLIRLARDIRPDLPATWRSLSLDDNTVRDSLTHLAQRALATDATPEEIERVQALFQADLRGAFTNP